MLPERLTLMLLKKNVHNSAFAIAVVLITGSVSVVFHLTESAPSAHI